MCRTLDLSHKNGEVNTNVLLRCYAGTAKDPFVKGHATLSSRSIDDEKHAQTRFPQVFLAPSKCERI